MAPGAQLTAHLRNGQFFKGATQSYNPGGTERFVAGPASALSEVGGRLGDRPALNVPATEEGLWLIVYETDDTLLTYDEWDKFVDFDQFHDLGGAPDAHLARGLPQTGFGESYRRYCKALVAVGDGAGSDVQVGMDVEIVLETNPYTAEPGAPILARLYADGAVRGKAQLEMFQRVGDEEPTRALLRSDGDGLVTVPTVPGSEVMLNFVTLDPLEGDPAAREPVWHSRWASLTYAVPAPE